MSESYNSQTTNVKETFSITLLNPNYDDSQFLENKINNIFDKRDNLDADPLIQEIRAVPRTLSKQMSSEQELFQDLEICCFLLGRKG